MNRVRVVLTVWLFTSLLLCQGCEAPAKLTFASPLPFLSGTATILFRSLTPSDEETIASYFLYPSTSITSTYIGGLHALDDIAMEEDSLHFRCYDLNDQCFYRVNPQGGREKIFAPSLELSPDGKLIWAPNYRKAVYVPPAYVSSYRFFYYLFDLEAQQYSISPEGAIWAGWWRNDPVFWDQKGPNARLGVLSGSGWNPQWISPPFSYRPFLEIALIMPQWNEPGWTFQWDRFIFFRIRGSKTFYEETWALDTNTGHYLYVGNYQLIKPLCAVGDDVLFWFSWEDQWDPQYRLPIAGLVISHNRGPLQPVLALQDAPCFTFWPESDLLYFCTGSQVFFLRFHDDGTHQLTKLNVSGYARFLEPSHLFVWASWESMVNGGGLGFSRTAASPPP
ncbi:MAG: hypothetical protein WCP58_10850 [bacterium]